MGEQEVAEEVELHGGRDRGSVLRVPVALDLGRRRRRQGRRGRLPGAAVLDRVSRCTKTPVLLSAGERAELATDEFLPLCSTLEGVVILKKNPDHVPTTLDDKTGKTPEKPGNMRINKPLAAW